MGQEGNCNLKIVKYFELNDNENSQYQNFQSVAEQTFYSLQHIHQKAKVKPNRLNYKTEKKNSNLKPKVQRKENQKINVE